MYARIVGTGSRLPEKVVVNADLAAFLDTSDEWIVSRTGVQQRHVVSKGETTSSLAVDAAKKALEKAGLIDVGAVFVATCTPDRLFPSTAAHVQSALNLSIKTLCFDVQAACNGFVSALIAADACIRSGFITTALVVGAETMTRICDWSDRNTSVLFGDGAGAFVLKASSEPGFLEPVFGTDGSESKTLYVSGGLSSGSQIGTVVMNGTAVFRHAVARFTQMVHEVLAKNALTVADIDVFVFHQANQRIFKAVASALSVHENRFVYTGNRHANTSAASIPLAFDHALASGTLCAGQTVLLGAFGAGFSWSATILKIS